MAGQQLSLVVLVAAAAVGYALLRAGGPALRDEDSAVRPVEVALDEETAGGAAQRLARALSSPTLASEGAPNHMPADPTPFNQLHRHLEESFPLVYSKLEHERINDYSILFTWKGTDPALRPLLAMSHLDVVPAPTGGAYNWTHGPFSGAIADGFIWGRGALDVKVSLLQQMEAVAGLLRRGHTPSRTIYLAFGHDEEVGGAYGAAAIAALLRGRGVQLELVLDEGGLIMMDGIAGPSYTLVEQPVALIGTAEKGYVTWEVEVEGSGGHSSMPPVDGSSVASRISRILSAIDASPTTTRLGAPTTDWLRALAPAVKLAPLRALMQSATNWLVNPVVGQLMGQAGRELSPFVRTTCSVVKIEAGGIADNVLPKTGSLKLNFRLLPGQDAAFVRDYLQMVTRKEAAHVSMRQLGTAVPATPVAPASGPHWQLIKQAILETLQPEGGLRVAPYLVTGMTDSRHYNDLAGGRVYRFCPYRFTRSTIQLVHGVDERIAVDDFLRGIRFYSRIFDLATSDEGSEEAAAAAAAAAAGATAAA